MAYEVPNTTAELLLRAAEATHVLGSEASTDSVAEFLGGSPEKHAGPSLRAAEQLEFVTKGADDQRWNPGPLARVLSTAAPSEKAVLLRFQLQQFRPYALFRNRLLAGEGASDAARQTVLAYELDIDVLDAETVLVNWGTYSGGLVYGDDQRLLVTVDQDLLQEALQIYEHVMAKRDSVQAYIVENLGVDAASFVTGEILDYLVDSYLKLLTNEPPRDSLFQLGHAIEGFVKKTATIDPVIQIPGNKKTLGAVAEELRSQKRLNSKHFAIVMGLTALRNAADHTADPEIGGLTWAISRETTFAANHLSWSFMRSFFHVQQGKYSL